MPHDHHHHHPISAPNGRFKLAIALNVAIVVIEVIYGFLGHSIALISDAGHNFADVLSISFALGASILAARPPTKRRTYGFRRTTILAALLNAVILLLTTGAIVFGAVERFLKPSPVDGHTIWIVASIAIVLNAISASLFLRDRKHDLNIRAAYFHLVGDVAASSGVVIAGILIVWTGASWIDPLTSIIIATVILFGTWKILREAINLAADAVPEHIDADAIESYLRNIDGVADVHDLHIWGMSTTHVVLTAHLVIPEKKVEDNILFNICSELKRNFGIEHATLQVERGSLDCELASSHVI